MNRVVEALFKMQLDIMCIIGERNKFSEVVLEILQQPRRPNALTRCNER